MNKPNEAVINMEMMRSKAGYLVKPLEDVCGRFDGDILLDLDLLKEQWDTQPRLFELLTEYLSKHPYQAAPAPAVPKPQEEQIDIDKIVPERFEQSRVQHALEQVRREFPLLDLGDTREGYANGQQLKEWLVKNVKGYISVEGLRAAIGWLGPKGSNQLPWVQPAPPPAPPAPPVEVEILEPLPNGDPRLPTNATKRQQLAASIEQLKDLVGRGCTKYTPRLSSWQLPIDASPEAVRQCTNLNAVRELIRRRQFHQA